jgi:hypothetical protein
LDNYREAIKKVGETQILYPKVTAANPMAGFANSIAETVTGNSTGFNPDGSTVVVNVNAGLISDKTTLVSELNDMFTDFTRLNGNQFFGGFVGTR